MRKILAAVLLPKSHVGLDASSIIMAELKDAQGQVVLQGQFGVDDDDDDDDVDRKAVLAPTGIDDDATGEA